MSARRSVLVPRRASWGVRIPDSVTASGAEKLAENAHVERFVIFRIRRTHGQRR